MEDTYTPPPAGVPLSGNDKHVLRGRAQTLQPALTLGKDGVSAAAFAEFERALARDGLVKIRSSLSRDDLKAQCRDLAARSGAEFLGTVGRTASFYRAKPTPSEFE